MPIYSPASGSVAAPASWPFTIVQYQEYSGENGTITLEQTATSGNTVLAVLGTNAADTPALSGYTQIVSKVQSAFAQLTVFIKTSAGTETAITPTGVSTGNNTTFMALEISGSRSLDVQATSGKVPALTNATTWITPPSISPAQGAMVFLAAAWCDASAGGSGGAPFGFPQVMDVNWVPLLISPSGTSATRMVALWVYKGNGVGSALQPGLVCIPPLFDATTGIAAATFSIK